MPRPTAAEAVARLKMLADPARARTAQWFFKTGPGEYGEGDQFLGIRVPAVRALVRELAALPLTEVRRLLRSPWHEARLLAVLVLVRQYDKSDDKGRVAIFRLYLASTKHLNNWDIIDSSAPHIVGRHLDGRGTKVLRGLTGSKSLWERRIAMLATHWSIRHGEYEDAITIATMLLKDDHDLIHKASGWMLREVGQRDRRRLVAFLEEHAAAMPRTMLRYAIEKLPAATRARFLGARATARHKTRR